MWRGVGFGWSSGLRTILDVFVAGSVALESLCSLPLGQQKISIASGIRVCAYVEI
jgi:hypothetical protein